MRRSPRSLPANFPDTSSRVSPPFLHLSAVYPHGSPKSKIAPSSPNRRSQRRPWRRSEARRHSGTQRPAPIKVPFAMRFDRFRRRPAPPPSPAPPSPLPSARSGSGFRDAFYDDTHSSPPPLKPVLMSRKTYMRNLQARMEQMERVPTRSFFQSYAGEFDVRYTPHLTFFPFQSARENDSAAPVSCRRDARLLKNRVQKL